jgi:hypothetical protein
MSEFTLTTPSQEPGYQTAMEVVFQWNYDPELEELRNLYVKAAEAQWISERDLHWDQPIDLVKFSTTPLGAGIPLALGEDRPNRAVVGPMLAVGAGGQLAGALVSPSYRVSADDRFLLATLGAWTGYQTAGRAGYALA